MRQLALYAAVMSAMLIGGCDGGDEGKKTVAPPSVEKPGNALTNMVNDLSETDVNKKIDQVKQFINEKKLDQADQLLASLEKVKDKLPAALQEKIQAAREMLSKAR